MARAVTIRTLALEAGLDLDEALVTVWDEGLDEIEDVDKGVPSRLLPAVRRALGVERPKDLMQISFWERRWGLDRGAVQAKLKAEYGIEITSGARVLPKGALKRLQRDGTGSVPKPVVQAARQASQVIEAAPEVLVWKAPGRHREIAPLHVDEIRQVHEALVADFAASGDPIEPPGVREEQLLQSAASRPETSLSGIRKYDTVEAAAAALLHSLVHNHPFHNGNKRTALVTMLVFLDRNSLLLTCTEKELFRQVLRVAQHRLAPVGLPELADREVLEIAEWICRNCRTIRRDERLLKWKELKRLLANLGCDVGSPLPGNKIKIERDVEERVLGFKRRRRLRVTAGHRNDGSEVDIGQLNYIRRELHLDERHGYDSDYFYGRDPREPDEFIAQYRTLLRRLGKL